ncbi:MAG: long-chain fatty acid--CoA ligase [Anaerolineae bacterium]|jgi:long-chain acyl-CoA synthetase|nr:long-chain fatty acid--CoA ligase [Anaerolineae bacterium]MDH7474712.1 long-chain fatty acid--CoA ligase [Anaerolineae bacterium]
MEAVIEKPWLKHYEEGVPATIDYPKTVMPDVLADTARKHPAHPAMIFKGTKLSYGEFNRLVDKLAAGLQKLGVKKSDRVAVHLPNCPQFPISYYAILRAGGIVVPCNPTYVAREMEHQLNDSGSEVIITLSAFYPLIKQIRAKTQLRHVIVAKIKTYLPGLLRFLFTIAKEKKEGHAVDISGDAHTYWFQDVLAQAPEKPTPVDLSWDDTAVLMYTGGTTGVSKGAQLTHKNILVNAIQCKHWMKTAEATEIVLTTLPLFHSYGMTTCMNHSVCTASTMILVPNPRDLKDVLETINKYHPTVYPGVPAMYVAINNDPGVLAGKYNVRSIRACVSGAAGLPVEVQKKFEEITGGKLVEGYGLSEATPVTHANPIFGENRVGTIGLPWPDTEAVIMDLDTGEKILPPGEAGELCIRGPQVMKGYWNMPTETANTLRGGWLHTGDIAVMDEDGYFRIVDRKKDMILGAGGFNIYPREIEDVLYEHPKVKEVAAVGVPVGEKGERPKVFIVLKEGETATEEEVLEFCRQNLAPYKVPKFVEFRDELPKSMVGKILRRVLLEEELKKQQGKTD